MKTLNLAAIALAASLSSISASPPLAGPGTIKDVSQVIPLPVLQHSVSPKFYRSLRVSPIKGWIVVRGQLSGTHLSGLRLVRSSLHGAYDPLALQLAKEVRITGSYSLGKQNPTHNVLMHLLIYQIADGTMALSFAHLDEPGGDQLQYFGCAKLSVLKGDGRWTEIKGPESLQDKGWAVRENGTRNSLSDSLKMDNLPHDTPIRDAYDHYERHY